MCININSTIYSIFVKKIARAQYMDEAGASSAENQAENAKQKKNALRSWL